MPKQGVSKISGNTSPVVGEKQIYHIAEWYPDTPVHERNSANVTWELFKKRNNGQFTTTNIRKKGIGEFTFGETAWKNTYRLEAYLPEHEGGGLVINPQPSKTPKINKIDLFYVNDTQGNTFSFRENLRAKAYCVNMFGKELVFTLWEDDAKGAGHNAQNEAIETLKAKAGRNGVATVEFSLFNALRYKAAQGIFDVKQLKFYVTAEYYEKQVSENVKNPLYWTPGVPPPPLWAKPQENKGIPKAKSSPAQQKSPSKKEQKGIINALFEFDKDKKLWDWAEAKGTAAADKQPTINVDNTNKPVKKGDGQQKKEETECFCKKKENQFYWSDRLTCKQRKKVLQVCADIWGENDKAQKAGELMSILHLETEGSFEPSKENGKGYVGLIQFSGATAQALGTSYDKLKSMTFTVQMDYVEKYIRQNKNKLKNIVDFYLQVLKPNAVGNGDNPNYIVFDEGIATPDGDGSKTPENQRRINITKEPWVTKYGYSSNPSFMKEEGEHATRKKWVYTRQQYENRYGFDNGKTYIWEIEQELKEKHYNPGKSVVFNGKCENTKEQKKEPEKTKGERAPWMPIALAEFEKYKGLREMDSPLKEKIPVYFESSSAKGLKYDYSNPWCGAFVVWCFEQTEDYTNINNAKSAAAFGWKGNAWEKGESCEAFVGATIIFDYSHVAFIVGENNDGTRYVYLGGNQGNGEQRAGFQKICMGSVLKNSKSILGITKPKKYVISEEDKKLPKYDVNAENTKESSR